MTSKYVSKNNGHAKKNSGKRKQDNNEKCNSMTVHTAVLSPAAGHLNRKRMKKSFFVKMQHSHNVSFLSNGVVKIKGLLN